MNDLTKTTVSMVATS